MAINEGQTVQYTVVTTRVPDGTTLYWKTTGNTTNSDIVGGNTGSVTITNNQAVFNVTTFSDVSTDGTKTLGISLSTGSQNGPTVVSTANPITVTDTSLSPVNRIYSWGSGSYALGLNDQGISRSSPTQIGSDTTWTDISSGSVNALAIKSGMLLTWGANYQGRLGLNDAVNRSSPVQVGSDTTWSTVTAGSVCFAIKTNETLWSWGNGAYGILGLNLPNGTYRSSPIQVGTDTNWSQIEAQELALAIKTDGTLWSWGFNNVGQLGQNFAVPDSTSSPTQIGSDSTWSKIATYNWYSMAIKTNGTLWSWGYNPHGTLGQNNTNSFSSPTQVGALTNWSNVALGAGNAVAVKNDGTLWTWGQAYAGALGNQNPNTNKSSPIQVGTDTSWSNCFAAQYDVSALKTNNTLWTWGANDGGLLGQNDTIFRSSPTQVGTLNTWKLVAMGQYQNFGIEGS